MNNPRAVYGTLAALLCGISSTVFAAGTVEVDGSSTVYPITEAVAEEFQKVGGGTRVTVGISGTGGGFKRFCRAETDISDASRPILKEEMVAVRTKRREVRRAADCDGRADGGRWQRTPPGSTI